MSFEVFIEKLVGEKIQEYRNFYIAFTHPSFDKKDNYERLEFLGDAVLNVAISHILYFKYSKCSEGILSKKRASLINGKVLAFISKTMGLHKWINLGKGEEKDLGNQKESILSNVFEAFIGAIYLTKGMDFVIKWLEDHFDLFESSKEDFEDYKSLLQELLHAKKSKLPEYVLEKEVGMAHKKTFYVKLILSENNIFEGIGNSKKSAEQDAAKKAYLFLMNRKKHG
ncbi:MAG: ribonuclease III [Proteobacteria bacterium]|nr:ribonuclease III [Pseudomonadota bacterium]